MNQEKFDKMVEELQQHNLNLLSPKSFQQIYNFISTCAKFRISPEIAITLQLYAQSILKELKESGIADDSFFITLCDKYGVTTNDWHVWFSKKMQDEIANAEQNLKQAIQILSEGDSNNVQ